MLSKPFVYLCSRVAKDARPLNSIVAKSLIANGFEVYVPHEQAPNNPADGRFCAEDIYHYDFAAMQKADLCVVVGKTGKDCSFEIGWFSAKSIPVFFVPAGDTSYLDTPMALPALTSYPLIEATDNAGEQVARHFKKPVRWLDVLLRA